MKASDEPPDVLVVRGAIVNFHVLRDAGGLYLIDAGFIGGRAALARALEAHGWASFPLRGIILTHGHIDHILNVAALAKETGAWIAAPRLDSDHYAGRPRYRRLGRIKGWAERLGFWLLRSRPFVPQRWLDDGDTLELWQGLRAVHLPGHTLGHTGFYCERLRLLFSADLFASYPRFSHFPPGIFNSAPEKMAGSVERALSLGLAGVMPNHGGPASPAEHLARLRRLSGR